MKKIMLAVFFLAACGAVFGQEQEQEQTATTKDQATVTHERKNHMDVLLSSKTFQGDYHRTASALGMQDKEFLVGVYLTEDNDTLLKGGFSTDVLQNKTPFDFDIGARIYLSFQTEPDDDVIGIGGGIQIGYTLEYFENFPIYFASNVYYAPEVITSGKDIDVLDAEPIRVEFGLTPTIKMVAGLRNLKVGDKTLSNDYNLGFSLKF